MEESSLITLVSISDLASKTSFLGIRSPVPYKDGREQIDAGIFSKCDIKSSVAGNDYVHYDDIHGRNGIFGFIDLVTKQLALDLKRNRDVGVPKVMVTNLHPVVEGARKFKHVYRPCCESKTNETNCGNLDIKGIKQYTPCHDPNSYFYWDDVQPTQAAWAAVFEYPKPELRQFLSL
ncbi:putative GDSL esterase/lipase [Cocos nucifera]|uniref:Putative GDSL esterase/lipase n=1 Tax=Cocos nucifera TaxID=13894 RepID=A0A8K0I1C2_COCNU|nr:putative GDSL esterase/lipase [Cocos nucifera]KAG1334036.1 putative GDSL esterase/lipase [Cocos nucifera]